MSKTTALLSRSNSGKTGATMARPSVLLVTFLLLFGQTMSESCSYNVLKFAELKEEIEKQQNVIEQQNARIGLLYML